MSLAHDAHGTWTTVIFLEEREVLTGSQTCAIGKCLQGARKVFRVCDAETGEVIFLLVALCDRHAAVYKTGNA